MPLRLSILALLWMGWCFLHSFLISVGLTTLAQRYLGGFYKLYRLAFNFFSLTTLIPVLIYYSQIEGGYIVKWVYPYTIIQYILFGGIAYLFYLSVRCYDLQILMGIRQARSLLTGVDIPKPQLSSSGMLRVVRHPLYALFILSLWVRNITPADLVTSIILTAYIIIGSFLEERKLVLEFGDEYRKYREGVSRLFPYKWLRQAQPVSYL